MRSASSRDAPPATSSSSAASAATVCTEVPAPGRAAGHQTRLGPAWTGPGRPPGGLLHAPHRARRRSRRLLTDVRRGTLVGADVGRHVRGRRRRVPALRRARPADRRGHGQGLPRRDRRLPAPRVRRRADRGDHPGHDRRLQGDADRRGATVEPGDRAPPDRPARRSFKRARRVYGLAAQPRVRRPRRAAEGRLHGRVRHATTGEEIELLAAHAHDDQDAAIYRTAAYTGLRQGELLALRWRDVDFVGGPAARASQLHGAGGEGPEGQARPVSVPMMPRVVDALARLKEREHLTDDDDLVFCNTVGEHLDAWALRRRFYAALERAGLRRIRFHDLRHTFGTVGDHRARRVRGAVLHGPPALLDDAAVPAPQAAPAGRAAPRGGGSMAARPVSPTLSRTGDVRDRTERNSAQLNRCAKRNGTRPGACKAVYTGSIPVGASTGFAGRPWRPGTYVRLEPRTGRPQPAVASWSNVGGAGTSRWSQGRVAEQVLGDAHIAREPSDVIARKRGASCGASRAKGHPRARQAADKAAREPVQTSGGGDSPVALG